MRRSFEARKSAHLRMTQQLERHSNFRFTDSNSQALAFPRRRASWAFSFLPSTLRGDGTPKGAPCNRPRLISRLRKTEAHGNASQRPAAAISSSLGPIFRYRREPKLAIQAGFRPPFACTPQPIKAEPRSRLGRLPKAPRVHACEAQPRAPHPTGSGYPSPAKLSLCPTSVTPLEAPLTGQDGRTIRPTRSAGIGIHSQVRERRLADFRSPDGANGSREYAPRWLHPGYRLIRKRPRLSFEMPRKMRGSSG
jgi:hypothetical protein